MELELDLSETCSCRRWLQLDWNSFIVEMFPALIELRPFVCWQSITIGRVLISVWFIGGDELFLLFLFYWRYCCLAVSLVDIRSQQLSFGLFFSSEELSQIRCWFSKPVPIPLLFRSDCNVDGTNSWHQIILIKSNWYFNDFIKTPCTAETFRLSFPLRWSAGQLMSSDN